VRFKPDRREEQAPPLQFKTPVLIRNPTINLAKLNWCSHGQPPNELAVHVVSRGRILKEGESASASLLEWTEIHKRCGHGTPLVRPTRSAFCAPRVVQKNEQTEDEILEGGILFVRTKLYIPSNTYTKTNRGRNPRWWDYFCL